MYSDSLSTPEAISSQEIAESILLGRKTRWNPLRTFSGERLARALDSFEAGYLREFALLAHVIAERDDTIAGVKAKREKAVAHKRRETVALDSSPLAEEQKEILETFWNTAKWVNAWDRSQTGKFSRLVKAMQQCVSFRYAAHHLVWKPKPDGSLQAVFEYVPLWFFENREAELRFLSNATGSHGTPLDPEEWMISTGDGLMIPCAIGYSAKRLSMMDWIRFSEKFSIPGVHGKTSAQKGTPEGQAMKSAVESFANDWACVEYGADGTSEINLIEANGSPNAMPMPALIEMVNRKVAALYRGADLSTMSSGSEAEGTGASLQGEETDILERDDAAARSEELQGIEKIVLEWHYGPGVDILAETQIVVPEKEDQSLMLSALETFVGMGAQLNREKMLKRFGLTEAADDEETFSPRQDSAASSPARTIVEETLAQNARSGSETEGDEILEAAVEVIAQARAEDAARLRDRFRMIFREGNAETMRLALAQLRSDLPNYLEDVTAAEDAWQRLLLAAVAAGWAAEEQDAA